VIQIWLLATVPDSDIRLLNFSQLLIQLFSFNVVPLHLRAQILHPLKYFFVCIFCLFDSSVPDPSQGSIF